MRNLIVLLTLCILTSCAGALTYHTKGIKTLSGEPGMFRGTMPLNVLRKTPKATLALWVKPEGKQDANLLSIGANDPSEITTSRACLHLLEHGGIMVFARVFDKQEPRLYLTSEQEGLIKPDQWNHIAAVIHYDKNQVELYVNGQSVGYTPKEFSFEQKTTPDSDSREINIGGEENGKDAMFRGKIAKVYVQKQAASQKIIQQLFSEKPE